MVHMCKSPSTLFPSQRPINMHVLTFLVSCGQQRGSTGQHLCADLMPFSTLAPGPEVGQSCAKTNNPSDHL